MDIHPRKRLEIIIERMAEKRACRILEEIGVTGYTVIPAMAGFGNGNRWERDRDISHASDMVVIISITDEETVLSAMMKLKSLFDAHIGVFSVSDAGVMRPDRF
jgi:PII-like signaling protein